MNLIIRIFYKWLTLMSKPFIRLILFVVTILAVVAASLFIYRFNPFVNALPLSCSFYKLTGLFCPGCGMTRAIYSAVHGRLIDAFSYNLLWPLIMFFVIGIFLLWFYFLFTGKNPFTPINSFLQKYSFSGWIIAITLIVFWIIRNIPVYPFTLLMPG